MYLILNILKLEVFTIFKLPLDQLYLFIAGTDGFNMKVFDFLQKIRFINNSFSSGCFGKNSKIVVLNEYLYDNKVLADYILLV